jgi:hypothetical protein
MIVQCCHSASTIPCDIAPLRIGTISQVQKTQRRLPSWKEYCIPSRQRRELNGGDPLTENSFFPSLRLETQVRST